MNMISPRQYVKTRRPIPPLTKEVEEAIWVHAKAEAPNECCGGIVLRPDGVLVYLPQPNISSAREDRWRMSKRSQLELLEAGKLIALVHSHPDGPAYPSGLDMQRQMEMQIPWLIVSFGGGLPNEFIWLGCGNRPLIGRGFRHGITDCFEFGRDYYLYNLGLELKSRPRDWRWWKQQKEDGAGLMNMYLDNFEEEGFVDVGKSAKPKVHDAMLCMLRSKVPNHLMIYIGNGLVAHHPASWEGCDNTKLSVEEPYEIWAQYHTHTLRYGGLIND
jgi:proteasome lid subunit RPN8/RPN11